MTKRIVILRADGTQELLERCPTWKQIHGIVAGNVEAVRVLDHVTEGGRFCYTMMLVNEQGLLHHLPRNAQATQIYQRNVRTAYAHSANPFRDARLEFARRAGGEHRMLDLTPPWAIAEGYKDDPWVAGDVVWFDGYTVESADAALAEAMYADHD